MARPKAETGRLFEHRGPPGLASPLREHPRAILGDGLGHWIAGRTTPGLRSLAERPRLCAHEPLPLHPRSRDTTTTVVTENPLLGEWTTPFGLPPFARIVTEHLEAAFAAPSERGRGDRRR